jgi:hypothetical protein
MLRLRRYGKNDRFLLHRFDFFGSHSSCANLFDTGWVYITWSMRFVGVSEAVSRNAFVKKMYIKTYKEI